MRPGALERRVLWGFATMEVGAPCPGVWLRLSAHPRCILHRAPSLHILLACSVEHVKRRAMEYVEAQAAA